MTLEANDGLIEVIDYYGATDLPNGAVKDLVEHEKIKQGSMGSEIKQRSYEYAERTVGSQTVHPLAKETVYRNEDGTGAIETSYEYTWHTGTVQMQERTTTLPAIPAEQNGSGIAVTRRERFDQDGRVVWQANERGVLTHHFYVLRAELWS